VIALLLGLLLSWTLVCFLAGEIVALRRIKRRLKLRDAEDMDALDKWATEQEARQ